ncbi:MAG: hypothetical protein JXR94_01385 [Candidatus Hydrogenedentes bacterium]|nr:hypothetical protein [Candidatus Hydrogenedentota bacterium]
MSSKQVLRLRVAMRDLEQALAVKYGDYDELLIRINSLRYELDTIRRCVHVCRGACA